MKDNVEKELDSTTKTKSRRNKIIISIVGIITLCCIGIIASGAFLNEADEEDESVTARTQEQDTDLIEETNIEEGAVEEVTTSENENNLTNSEIQETSSPTDTPIPTNTPEPTNTPVPTSTPDPNLVEPGTYMVGSDIQPGIYRGETGTDFFDSCYWARLSDLSGEFSALLANDNGIGQFYVEVLGSDFALETQCEITYLDSLPEPPSEYPQILTPGTYIIGTDIQPGIYRGETGIDPLDSCYWARLSGLSGDFDSLKANDNNIGQFYVEILDSDYAFNTQCEITLLSTLPEPSGDFLQQLAPGTYIVGRDIQAGTYKGEAGADVLESCYWARLSDVSGEFSALIANNNNNGQYFVQVQENDFALITACGLELVEE